MHTAGAPERVPEWLDGGVQRSAFHHCRDRAARRRTSLSGSVSAMARSRGMTCPCRKSDPDVLVVETTENRPRKNPADGMNYT
jgi:hypothetical protein